jgi:YD repeat-containing protein
VLREEHHDGTESAYAYNADGLLMKASNEEGIIEFSRDRAGRIVSESFGGTASNANTTKTATASA